MKVKIKATGDTLEVKAIETVEEKVNEIGQHILHYQFYKPEEVEIINEQKQNADKQSQKADDYAKVKMREAFDFLVDNSNKMMSEIFKKK